MGKRQINGVKNELKYPRGMPIASLSKDNGDWQPVNAKGTPVDAL